MEVTTIQTPEPSVIAKETVLATPDAVAAPQTPAEAPEKLSAPADPVAAEAALKAAKEADEIAAKEARKAERKATNGGLSALARQTADRFSQTRQAQAAQTAAQRAEQAAARTAQDAATRVRELEAVIEGARKAPWKWAKEQGLTPQQVAEEELAADTPDAKLTAKFRELDERVAAANARAEAAENEAKSAEERFNRIVADAKERQEAAQKAERWEEIKRSAFDNFSKEKDKFPNLYRLCPNPNAFARKILATKNELEMHEDPEISAAARGGLYSDVDIAEYIEFQFKSSGAQASPATASGAATAGGAAPNGSAPAHKVGSGSAPATVAPTLTASDSTSASTAKGWPTDFDSWDDRKQNKWIAEAMKNGTLPRE